MNIFASSSDNSGPLQCSSAGCQHVQASPFFDLAEHRNEIEDEQMLEVPVCHSCRSKNAERCLEGLTADLTGCRSGRGLGRVTVSIGFHHERNSSTLIYECLKDASSSQRTSQFLEAVCLHAISSFMVYNLLEDLSCGQSLLQPWTDCTTLPTLHILDNQCIFQMRVSLLQLSTIDLYLQCRVPDIAHDMGGLLQNAIMQGVCVSSEIRLLSRLQRATHSFSKSNTFSNSLETCWACPFLELSPTRAQNWRRLSFSDTLQSAKRVRGKRPRLISVFNMKTGYRSCFHPNCRGHTVLSTNGWGWKLAFLQNMVTKNSMFCMKRQNRDMAYFRGQYVHAECSFCRCDPGRRPS